MSGADVHRTLGAADAFDKYRVLGSYHWTKLQGRGIRFYHARLWARYGWFIRRVAKLEPALVVDVGCGDAALTHLLADSMTGAVVGIEPDDDGVELAEKALERAGSRASVSRGTAQRLPFGDAVVDVVVLCEVIEHLIDVDRGLAEVARILHGGGTLLLSTPRKLASPADARHVREFAPDELRLECRQHFRTVDVFVAEPRLLQRLFARSAGRWLLNALAAAHLNAFELTFRSEPRFVRFGQLYAIASGPRREGEDKP
ncbi:MAG: class I SAM-dependent methyltransferase [Gaiellaceae bacterium]